MSLLLNMLSRLVIAFLPRSKHLLISWLQSPSAVILEPKNQNKTNFVTIFLVSPSICHEVMGRDAMIFIFLMLSFKPGFSLSSFIFINRLFSLSLLSSIRVVVPAYLRLLIFLLAILIPTCASSSPAFSWCTLHRCWISRVIIYSLDVLFVQFGSSPLFHVRFCVPFLTCVQASQESGKVVWYSYLSKNFLHASLDTF